jgi:hypothetical protein
VTPVVTFEECQTTAIGTPSGGHLLGPWMPMASSGTDGFDECSTPAVSLSEGAVAQVTLTQSAVVPVTLEEGSL